jgi:hypothetical protein
MFADSAGITTPMVPTDDAGHILAIYRELVENFREEAETPPPHWSIDDAINLGPN